MNRISELQLYFGIVDLLSQRATCLRRGVGAIVVKEGRVLSTGYNGSPSRLTHCNTCLRDEMGIPSGQRQELCRAIHAEQNAIIFAAKHGISINESVMYVNTFPCNICAKIIINSGIKELYFVDEYPDELSMEILHKAGVIIYQYDREKDLATRLIEVPEYLQVNKKML